MAGRFCLVGCQCKRHDLDVRLEIGRKVSLAVKGKPKSSEHKAKIRETILRQDRKHTPEELAKQSASLMGHTTSQETKDKISKANLGKPKSATHRQSLSIAHAGVPLSSEHRKSLSKAKTGKPHPIREEVKPKRLAKFRSTMLSRYGSSSHPNSGNGKVGFRLDLGHNCRSTFEANYCRYLIHSGIQYQYEPQAFNIKLPDNRTTTYTPDLYFPSSNTWLELKGYLSPEAAAKMELFKKQYPNERFSMLMQSSNEWQGIYDELKDIVPCWEYEVGNNKIMKRRI